MAVGAPCARLASPELRFSSVMRCGGRLTDRKQEPDIERKKVPLRASEHGWRSEAGRWRDQGGYHVGGRRVESWAKHGVKKSVKADHGAGGLERPREGILHLGNELVDMPVESIISVRTRVAEHERNSNIPPATDASELNLNKRSRAVCNWRNNNA